MASTDCGIYSCSIDCLYKIKEVIQHNNGHQDPFNALRSSIVFVCSVYYNITGFIASTSTSIAFVNPSVLYLLSILPIGTDNLCILQEKSLGLYLTVARQFQREYHTL